jgi:hypothetical protein
MADVNHADIGVLNEDLKASFARGSNATYELRVKHLMAVRSALQIFNDEG